MFRGFKLLVVCIASALLISCGSSGGGVGTVSLSGTIVDSNGAGIAAVVVRVENLGTGAFAQATTDAAGSFIVLNPPTGLVEIIFDASGAAGTYSHLEFPIQVGGGMSNLSQAIVLADLSTGTTLSVAVDAGGATMMDETISNPDGSSLFIPNMTVITVDGAIPTGPVDMNVTPVDPINVPMPLPGMLDAGAFVTIQPPTAAFTPALDVTLPNPRGFPVGTMVDIWSFDHDQGMWVNRSAETGNQGVVTDVMGELLIVATGVITEGGWHSGALPVDPDCATSIQGQVFVLGSAAEPIRDALISLSSGQFAATDINGRFRIDLVPAYDAALLGGMTPMCVPIDVDLRVLAPVSFGAGSVNMTIPAGMIMTGGVTDVGGIDVPATDSGSLVGSVVEDGLPVDGTVNITGPETTSATVEDGSFFISSLMPGTGYNASFDFKSAGSANVGFAINARQTTFVNISGNTAPPTGGDQVEVQVVQFGEDGGFGLGMPLPNICVTLQGAAGASLFRTTDGGGIATFQNAPTGPYTVTAQQDDVDFFGISRRGQTLIGVVPSGSPPRIVIPFFDISFGGPVAGDATLNGTILNPPANSTLGYQIASSDELFFVENVAVSTFSEPVPSGLPLDVGVVAIDLTSGEVLSTVHMLDVMLTSGQTLDLDFDFNGPNGSPFDIPVPVTYNGTPMTDEYAIELEVGSLELELFFGSMGFPSPINLPDFSAAKFAGQNPRLDFTAGGFTPTFGFEDTDCEVPLGSTTPALINVDFLGFPSIQSPMDGENLPSFGSGSTILFTPGAGNGQNAGLESVSFFTEIFGPTETTFVDWVIFAPPGTTSVTLPVVNPAKPMTGDYAKFVVLNAGSTRFNFSGFDYTTFWGSDLSANLAVVETSELCGSETSVNFSFGTPPGPGLNAGDRTVPRASRARWYEALKH